MLRYIDAEKLKQKLIEGDGRDDDRFTEGYNFAINEIRGYIDNMSTVEAESVKGWISVKERLPKDNGIYMVWYKGAWDICEFDAESQTFGETYDEYDEMYSTFVCWDDGINKDVTHWMPLLLEPPKEDAGWVDDDSMPNEDMIPDNELICGW